MSQRQCEGCRWFLQHPSQHIGQCRRYPPTQNTEAGWLEVRAVDWCGEWADKTITPEQAERRELVRQFALAIVEGLKEPKLCYPLDIWANARRYAEAENWK